MMLYINLLKILTNAVHRLPPVMSMQNARILKDLMCVYVKLDTLEVEKKKHVLIRKDNKNVY